MGEQKRRYSVRGGIVRTIITDDATPDVFHVKHSQDVEAVLENVARFRETVRNDGDSKFTHHIPAVIYEELQRQGIADDPDLFKAWLNSSAADDWRIWKGKL